MPGTPAMRWTRTLTHLGISLSVITCASMWMWPAVESWRSVAAAGDSHVGWPLRPFRPAN